MIERWETDGALLYPWFARAVEELLRGGPFSWVVSEGFRTLDEQGIRYRKARADGNGPRLPPPGKSPHNYGCAVHIYPHAVDMSHYDIRHRGWSWLQEHLPTGHAHLWHGRGSWRWRHIEWRSWRDIAWGEVRT